MVFILFSKYEFLEKRAKLLMFVHFSLIQCPTHKIKISEMNKWKDKYE